MGQIRHGSAGRCCQSNANLSLSAANKSSREIFMKPISYKRHRFPPDTIRLAVWLYYRFTTSLRDVEEMLAERGIDVTYETVRCWANKFGPPIAANIRRRRGRADSVWHLDEMVVRINDKRLDFGMIPRIIRRLHFMWCAIDKEGSRRSRPDTPEQGGSAEIAQGTA